MYLKREIYDTLIDWKENSRLTLEVHGARQVGKTFIVNKFADENFKRKIYINLLELSGEEFIKCIDAATSWNPQSGQPRREKPLHYAFSLFEQNFVDDEETVIIIDEIQEKALVYNMIREFTRSFKARFIVTGSYLGRLMNDEFKFSSGDLLSVRIETLTFEEFLDAFGKRDEYEQLDLYGQSEREAYEEIAELHDVYIRIGGYPAVVKEYINTKSISRCIKVLEDIIHLFSMESIRYYKDILDTAAYENLFCSITRIFVREKKGLEKDNFNEDLQKLVSQEYNSNLSKAVCNRAINWLYSSGIIDFAGKIVELDVMDFKNRCRCYFTDTGLAYYFMRKIGAEESNLRGFLYENFVYLELRRRTVAEVALEIPAFATFAGGEIDFLVKSNINEKKYALEVKAGKNSQKITMKALAQGKIDYVVYLKGNTLGGMDDNVITIPVYLFGRYRFD